MAERIGWIGLGRMGLPMAGRLVTAGHRVIGFDASLEARASFVAIGGEAATSPRTAAAGADVLFTMLPDGAAVRSVLTDGDDAAAPALSPSAAVVDMSSSAPSQTIATAALLADRGVALVDAPVSGGVPRAIDGTLAIMAGGDVAAIDRVAPLLAVLGSDLFRTGVPGSGHAMKALNNYVSCAGLIAACEAVRIGARFGLDPDGIVDILNASTGRNNSTERKLRQHILSEKYASGFALSLMTKDVGIAADLAAELGLDAPLSGTVASLAREALAALGPASDHTEIDRHRG